MRVGRESSEIEELAWLVKDNLYTKHLVLSAEELFVEFLQPDYGYNDLRDCTSSVVWRILRQAAAMMVQRRSEFGAGTDALVSAHASTPSG